MPKAFRKGAVPDKQAGKPAAGAKGAARAPARSAGAPKTAQSARPAPGPASKAEKTSKTSKAAKPENAGDLIKASSPSTPSKADHATAGTADGAKAKSRKQKLVRDSFTMPEVEYQVLGDLKKSCVKAGFEVKKSELLRIGVMLLQRLDTAQVQAALAELTPIKAGRPKKEK